MEGGRCPEITRRPVQKFYDLLSPKGKNNNASFIKNRQIYYWVRWPLLRTTRIEILWFLRRETTRKMFLVDVAEGET